MDIESIKKVKLLVSLKGTEGGKQILWLGGTVFDKDIKPFPSSVNAELQIKRIRKVLEVLEVYSKVDEVSSDIVTLDEEEIPAPLIVEPAEEKSEVPKDDSPPILTTRRRRR